MIVKDINFCISLTISLKNIQINKKYFKITCGYGIANQNYENE